jgi:hypothetical protein
MTHIKQNDPACLPDIQRIGCFFRSCGLIAEYKTGRSLSAYAINETWQWAKSTRRVDENNCVKDSASIATRFLRILGDAGRFVEVGTFSNGETRYYPAVSLANCRTDAVIQKIKQNGPSVTHFRVVDKSGKLIEDPHDPPIRVLGVYYSILYAYVPGETNA